MKKNFSLLLCISICLLLLVSAGCNKKDSSSSNTSDASSSATVSETTINNDYSPESIPSPLDDAKFPYVLKASIRSGMPEFTFTVDGNADESAMVVTSLRVENSDAKVILDIKFPENGDVWGGNPSNLERPVLYDEYSLQTMGLYLEDINFDGSSDITLTYNSYRNASYYAWVWDDAEGTYRYMPEYVMIENPILSPEHKMILSEGIGGAASHTYAVYQYSGLSLVLTNKLTDEAIPQEELPKNGDNMRVTEEALVNGELAVVKVLTYTDSTSMGSMEGLPELWLSDPWNLFIY